jgi:hypothetical protein
MTDAPMMVPSWTPAAIAFLIEVVLNWSITAFHFTMSNWVPVDVLPPGLRNLLCPPVRTSISLTPMVRAAAIRATIVSGSSHVWLSENGPGSTAVAELNRLNVP